MGKIKSMEIVYIEVESCISHPKKAKYLLTGHLITGSAYLNTYSWRAVANEDFVVNNIEKDIKINKSPYGFEIHNPVEAKSAIASFIRNYRLDYVTGAM